MLVLARVTLFAFLSVLTNGVDKEIILKGIEPISHTMECLLIYSGELLFLPTSVFNLIDKIRDIGQKFFPNLTDFAESMMMLNDQSNENDTDKSTIESELDKIKKAFEQIDYAINKFPRVILSNIENDMIREKFKSSYRNKINHFQKVFIEFVNLPNVYNKDMLRHECNTTNGMKDVLTDLHIEIVNKDGNNGTLNQLLDEVVSLKHKCLKQGVFLN